LNNINQILANCIKPLVAWMVVPGRPGAPGLIKTFALTANPAIQEDNPSFTLIDESAASPCGTRRPWHNNRSHFYSWRVIIAKMRTWYNIVLTTIEPQ